MSRDLSPTSGKKENDFDLIGIGFGPSGIALASAIQDDIESTGHSTIGSTCFLERQSDSTWQREMLLRETDIQHHFLRDLATPRNPRSRFTFCNYLKEKGRIYEFGELVFGVQGGAVSRLEWSDYLMWAADLLQDCVRYDEEVQALNLVRLENDASRLVLETPKGEYVARRLVCCVGKSPHIPKLFSSKLSDSLFHSADFKASVEGFDRQRDWRFVIIGSGQSAAEILIFLHTEFPNSTLVSVHRSLGFKYVDLCQFSNEVFHPEEIEFFYNLRPAERRRALQEASQTNYGVIDAQASDTLYRKIYEDTVVGTKRVELLKHSEIIDLEHDGSVYGLCSRNVYTGELASVQGDCVILCTGYEEATFPRLLEPLREYIKQDSDGAPMVTRDYRVETSEEVKVPIYLSGMSERTHGISDSASFSMMALSAERIFESLKKTCLRWLMSSECEPTRNPALTSRLSLLYSPQDV